MDTIDRSTEGRDPPLRLGPLTTLKGKYHHLEYFEIYFHALYHILGLDQGWANYGPRAKYGPLRGSMRPAEGLENAKKKMKFRKTFVRT
jgi:hypothetical protein